MNKTVLLGIYKGNKVIAEHPCSDICPDSTCRLVRYIVDVKDCTRIGGVIGVRFVPDGDAVGVREYCVPKILEREVDGEGMACRRAIKIEEPGGRFDYRIVPSKNQSK